MNPASLTEQPSLLPAMNVQKRASPVHVLLTGQVRAGARGHTPKESR